VELWFLPLDDLKVAITKTLDGLKVAITKTLDGLKVAITKTLVIRPP
jgi:hypothetical protein